MDNRDPARIRKRSVLISGPATSVSLEEAFWRELKHIARREGRSLNSLVTDIDNRRSGNLSSALRLYVLDHLKSQG